MLQLSAAHGSQLDGLRDIANRTQSMLKIWSCCPRGTRKTSRGTRKTSSATRMRSAT